MLVAIATIALITVITVGVILIMLTIDDLKAAVAENTALTAEAVAKLGAAPPDQSPTIDALAQQVKANNDAMHSALFPAVAPPPAAPQV